MRPYAVDSPWFSGAAEVATFTLEELIATKIRALYQRRNGRDLFDLWLAVSEAGASLQDIAECFPRYRPDGWNAELAVDNLEAKLSDSRFTDDLAALVPNWSDGYTIDAAAKIARDLIEAAA